MAQDLGFPAGARGAHHRHVGEIGGDRQEIGRGFPGQDRDGRHPFRPPCRDVLHAVHRGVDLARENGIVQGPDKDTLPADLVERDTNHLVPLRPDDGGLHLHPLHCQDPACHLGLRERKPAPPRPYPERHAA
jgi:hypothetical protein